MILHERASTYVARACEPAITNVVLTGICHHTFGKTEKPERTVPGWETAL